MVSGGDDWGDQLVTHVWMREMAFPTSFDGTKIVTLKMRPRKVDGWIGGELASWRGGEVVMQ